MSAQVLTGDEKVRFPFAAEIDPEGSDNIHRVTGLRSIPYLSEISVRLQLDSIPQITAVLTPPYHEAIALLDSPILDWGGLSELECQFGYLGPQGLQVANSPTYKGIILKPEYELGVETVLTVKAQGVGGYHAVRDKRAKTYTKMTRRAVLQAVIQEINEVAGSRQDQLTLDTSAVFKGDTASALLMTAEEDYVRPAGQNNWTFFQRVVEDCRCWISLVGNKFRILPLEFANSSQPVATFALYDLGEGIIGPEQNIFPIFSFYSPTMGVYLSQEVSGLLAKGFDPSTRQAKSLKATDAEVPVASTGAGSASSERHPDPVHGYFGDIDDLRKRDLMNARFERQRTGIGVRVELDTIGIPHILPGDSISVRGLGERISGSNVHRYTVFEITNTLNASGYVSSIVAVSNIAAALKGGVPNKGQSNTKKVKEGRKITVESQVI